MVGHFKYTISSCLKLVAGGIIVIFILVFIYNLKSLICRNKDRHKVFLLLFLENNLDN